jgi:hypothetical protein
MEDRKEKPEFQDLGYQGFHPEGVTVIQSTNRSIIILINIISIFYRYNVTKIIPSVFLSIFRFAFLSATFREGRCSFVKEFGVHLLLAKDFRLQKINRLFAYAKKISQIKSLYFNMQSRHEQKTQACCSKICHILFICIKKYHTFAAFTETIFGRLTLKNVLYEFYYLAQ